MTYMTISTDGVWDEFPGVPAYQDLHDGVGGYIEAVALNIGGSPKPEHEATLWLNEEGKLDGLPLNEIATYIALMYSGIADTDFIAGNVVLTGGPNEEGETLGLSPQWVTHLRKIRSMTERAS